MEECPLCSARFGESLRADCEEAMGRGSHVFRFLCGGCGRLLVAAMDDIGRIGISLDKTRIPGEFPVISPEGT